MKKNKILIGLAVYNEEQKLSKLLERLQKVAKNPNYFILIVNDFSTDNSALHLKKFAEKK